MDGGTQVIVFILTFAVDGGSGKAVTFPAYWGNNFQSGNYGSFRSSRIFYR